MTSAESFVRPCPTGSFRVHASSIAVLLGCLSPLTAGCQSSAARTATSEPSAASVAAEPSDPQMARAETKAETKAGCKDWSSTDPSTLPALPDTPYTATLEKAWDTLRRAYYDPTMGCRDWPRLREQYGEKLARVTTEAEAYAVMNAMLGELQQSHLAIIPPRKRIAGEPRSETTAGGTLPLAVRLIDGALLVVDAGTHGGRSKIPPGSVVEAIGKHEVAPMLTEVREVWEREVEVALRASRAASSWMSCEPGSTVSVRYKAPGKPKAKTTAVRCHEPQIERLTMGNIKDVPIEAETKMLPGTKIGYLRFNIWMVPLMARIESGLTDLRAQGMQALVIDLRGNPGGVGAMSVPLARLLLSKPASLGDMHMRSADQHFKVTPADDPFEGPVAVLIDEGTGSTSEIFAQAMQDLGRVTIVGGSPSQGAALPSLIEELPGGAILQYVVADYHSPKGIAVEGKGVQPDVLVDEAPEDFANGRDKVLETAVTKLSQ